MCSRLRRQLFQLLPRWLRSLKIRRLLLSWMSCFPRRIAICPMETLSPCCGLSRMHQMRLWEVRAAIWTRKKDGRQRIILDCRPCNRKFQDSPGTDLITGKSVSEFEIIDENFMRSSLCVHFGCADVDACFHSMRLHFEMCEYFCRKSIEAKWLGDLDIEGALVPSNGSVYSTQVSLPMGFSWATFFAQSVLCVARGITAALAQSTFH